MSRTSAPCELSVDWAHDHTEAALPVLHGSLIHERKLFQSDFCGERKGLHAWNFSETCEIPSAVDDGFVSLHNHDDDETTRSPHNQLC